MKLLSPSQSDYAEALAGLSRRAVPPDAVRKAVENIVSRVRRRGDAALVEFARKFDRTALHAAALRVTPQEMAAAERDAAPEVRQAILTAHRNVLAFARRSLRRDWKMRNAQGAEVGEVFQPFRRVGVYVPGGGAPLISTVLMTVTLAQAAGCPEIVVCTPSAPDGTVNGNMLCALGVCGATEVYRVGGAQAVAAMAHGTASIQPVEKIFGPGNKYVVEAKRQVFGAVSIDLLPGPSEIMVLCDASANPRFVAADLLAQAEHGHDGQILLATTSAKLLRAVRTEVEKQLRTLPRAESIREILDAGCWLVEVRDLAAGIRLCNDFAPEHLSLVVENEAAVLPQIHTAGAIFLGNHSPVAAGDFVAGPSHTLPTGGAGKSFPGLTADMFQRRTSIVKLDRKALQKSAPSIVQFSHMEGLEAHGRSASIRLKP
ncbi:MAG: histidinol dehydrogenase [Verrucomicrobiales bacterium]|nr:histidinol dehydrogenase [Verrucomicrobiales bacterium]